MIAFAPTVQGFFFFFVQKKKDLKKKKQTPQNLFLNINVKKIFLRKKKKKKPQHFIMFRGKLYFRVHRLGGVQDLLLILKW